MSSGTSVPTCSTARRRCPARPSISRRPSAAATRNQESLVRVLQNADTILSRVSNRSGTLGLLVADSALYRETTLTMIQLRQLLSDIQANPRKYFTFSVF